MDVYELIGWCLFAAIYISIPPVILSILAICAFVFKVIFFSGMKHSFEDDIYSVEVEMMKEELRKFSPPYD